MLMSANNINIQPAASIVNRKGKIFTDISVFFKIAGWIAGYISLSWSMDMPDMAFTGQARMQSPQATQRSG